MQIKSIVAAFLIAGTCLPALLFAENIDPYQSGSKYAWNENTGFLNFDPYLDKGAHVTDNLLSGYIWGENIGWIRLSCTLKTCGAIYGVANDGQGNLSGFAWGENVGWINFDPVVPLDKINLYRVRILPDGRFSGWAWGENIGWIHFDDTEKWDVQVCIVELDDLMNFASYWLETGTVANLDGTGKVDMEDFDRFTAYWQTYCPNGWTLK